MVARIYRPAKTAMQSGLARTQSWVLDFEPSAARQIEPLMGWTGASDMNAQVRLRFESKEAAVEYAKNNAIAYRIVEPKRRKPIAKSYADNFKYGRIGTWTH